MTDEIISRAGIIAGAGTDDELLAIYCEDAINYVLAYCHADAMTQELCGVTAQIAAAAYARGNSSGIASITEGDRQITYAISDAAQGFGDTLAAFVNRSGRVPSEVSSNV